MAGIRTLLSEVEALLRIAYPTLSVGFGASEVDWHGTPPRIVWIVTGAVHAAPEKPRTRMRSLLTRRVELVAHVWAADIDQLEALVDDTLVALYRTAHGSIDFAGEDWGEAEDAHHGKAAAVRFSVSAPVIERRFTKADRALDQAVTIGSPDTLDADTSTSAQGDGAIDWKEP